MRLSRFAGSSRFPVTVDPHRSVTNDPAKQRLRETLQRDPGAWRRVQELAHDLFRRRHQLLVGNDPRHEAVPCLFFHPKKWSGRVIYRSRKRIVSRSKNTRTVRDNP